MKTPNELIPLLAYRKSVIDQLQQGGDATKLLNEISLAGTRILELLQTAYNNQHPKG